MSTVEQHNSESHFEQPSVRATRLRVWLLVVFLGVPVAAPLYYGQTGTAGVWRPGNGAQWVHRGLSWDEFKTQDKTYFNQGLRVVDLEIAGGKYTAVWQPGSGAQWIHPGLSWQEFKTQDLTYFKQGLRVVDLEVVNGRYTAVWRPGTGAQWIHPALTWQEFKTQDLTYFKQGLRLTDLEVVDGRYTAVWRPGSGAQWVHPGLTWQQFRTQGKTYFDQGLRLVDFEVEDGTYTGVWRPGTGTQWVWPGLCFDEFKTQDSVYFAKGLRLTTVELTSNPKAIYRLPFDNIAGWKVSNGNWDDPIPGHGGKKTGLQAFAWDFVFDSNNDGKGESGQNIRAARGGTVYVVVESESKNSYQSKDLCKDGVGNYIVIDHGDGTFGTYWHLSQNGVIPKVGDHVNRGDKIAISGHTGVSSTPHVHFDVRTGWNLSYSKCNLNGTELPSVRVLFEDKNHACWIPRNGDILASNNN
jgi:murein DD-endopeptidase MepM/ murein hydrolase activator NlpD